MAAFAKLSGSLLDSNQRPSASPPASDDAAGSIEVARLYDELRDCIAANDQEGVRRLVGRLGAIERQRQRDPFRRHLRVRRVEARRSFRDFLARRD